MRLRRRFIARAAVAESVAVEDARLFEQADGAIDGGDGDAAVERRGAFIERLDIGMIRRIRDYARDDSTLLGDPQPLFLTQGFKVDRRSEEHTSELQSLMRISYAVFCLKNKKKKDNNNKQYVPNEKKR